VIEREDNRTMVDLAREAIQIQDACNLSGLVIGFARTIRRLRVLLEAEGQGGTTQINRHPVCVLWIDKFASLSGRDFSLAYDWAKCELAAVEDEQASVARCERCTACARCPEHDVSSVHPMAGVRCGVLTVDAAGVWRA
jgi:hypothetical protein